jgi:hypothetical protein
VIGRDLLARKVKKKKKKYMSLILVANKEFFCPFWILTQSNYNKLFLDATNINATLNGLIVRSRVVRDGTSVVD